MMLTLIFMCAFCRFMVCFRENSPHVESRLFVLTPVSPCFAVIVSQFTTYYRAKNDIFFQYFLSHADPEDNVARFFSASDVLDFIAQTRENYVNLDNSSIGNFNLDTGMRERVRNKSFGLSDIVLVYKQTMMVRPTQSHYLSTNLEI